MSDFASSWSGVTTTTIDNSPFYITTVRTVTLTVTGSQQWELDTYKRWPNTVYDGGRADVYQVYPFDTAAAGLIGQEIMDTSNKVNTTFQYTRMTAAPTLFQVGSGSDKYWIYTGATFETAAIVLPTINTGITSRTDKFGVDVVIPVDEIPASVQFAFIELPTHYDMSFTTLLSTSSNGLNARAEQETQSAIVNRSNGLQSYMSMGKSSQISGTNYSVDCFTGYKYVVGRILLTQNCPLRDDLTGTIQLFINSRSSVGTPAPNVTITYFGGATGSRSLPMNVTKTSTGTGLYAAKETYYAELTYDFSVYGLDDACYGYYITYDDPLQFSYDSLIKDDPHRNRCPPPIGGSSSCTNGAPYVPGYRWRIL